MITPAPAPKSILASKTFWFNALSIAYVVAGSFGWKPVPLDPATQVVVAGVMNVILRILTHQPVKVFG